jgi:cell wall-associated NlpC family hydrolase
MFMKKTYDNRIYLCSFTFFAIMFFMAGCKGYGEKNLQKEIDSISVAHVPDHRIGICKVKADPGEGGLVILSGETTEASAKIDIINTLDKEGIKFIDSILVIPDTVNYKYYSGLVTLSVINLRKDPDDASELISQAKLGTPVTILKSDGSWILIQTPDKYIAWTDASSVKPMSAAEIKAWKKTERVIYLENTGWIYSSPGETGVTGDIVAGCILQKDGESGKYVKVLLPDGRSGYVPGSSVENLEVWENNHNGNPEDICISASSLLGIPYLWGGNTPKGADCSGFVQSVFFMNGIILQRDASLQALHGQQIDLSDNFSRLLPGDLLFFGPTRNGKPRVTHVAIYKGNMEYIHSSGWVKINSLDSTKADFNGPRLKLLLMAKRIFGTTNDAGITAVRDNSGY